MTTSNYPRHISVSTIDRNNLPATCDPWLDQPLISMHIEVNTPEWSTAAWELIRPEGALLLAPPSAASTDETAMRIVHHAVADIPSVVGVYLGLGEQQVKSDLASIVVPLPALREVPQDADDPVTVMQSLERSSVDDRTAAGLTMLLAARRFSWRITTLSNRKGKAEERSMAALDAGPFGLWLLERGSEMLCVSPTTSQVAMQGIVGLLRAC
jgi:hypothetical protein